MNRLSLNKLAIIILLFLQSEAFSSVAASVALQTPGTEESWLDRPPANWNKKMSPLPRPVASANVAELQTRCLDLVRQPESPAENALVRAGWMLYGAVQSYEYTKVIFAMSDADGMCRPLGYQAFVYWEGRYAGTLSPMAMNSRTDGALAKISLGNPSRIFAEFARYSKSDALCCPSRISQVTFEVNRDEMPLVIPLSINTIPVEPKTENPPSDAALLYGKKWKLIEVDGAAIKTTNPYIEFDPTVKRISGDSGCNRLTGTFEVDGANLIFSRIASTRRACLDHEVQQVENNFLKKLEQTTTFQIQGETLRMYASGTPILSFQADH